MLFCKTSVVEQVLERTISAEYQGGMVAFASVAEEAQALWGVRTGDNLKKILSRGTMKTKYGFECFPEGAKKDINMEMRRLSMLQRQISEMWSDYPEPIDVTRVFLDEAFTLFAQENPDKSDAYIAWTSVRWLVREYEILFEDNYLDKFIFLIACMLFMMEHDTMDEEIAFEVKWDIMDFETGNYDDMFTPEELVYLKADIRKINAYLDEHPHLIEGVAEARAKAQSRL